MTVSQLAQIVIAAVAILATIAVATLGGVIRMAMRWGAMDMRLKQVTDSFNAMQVNQEREHTAIYAMMREDRRANNERFNRVESRVFSTSYVPPIDPGDDNV